MSHAAFEPKILAYVCNWCTYLGADLAGTNRLEYPSNVRIVRLPCTGRIDFNLIVKAFEIGADAVLVSGCHPGDCHYTAGNFHARRRWMLFRSLLDTLGIDMDRIHFTWISAAESAIQFWTVWRSASRPPRPSASRPARASLAASSGSPGGPRRRRHFRPVESILRPHRNPRQPSAESQSRR